MMSSESIVTAVERVLDVRGSVSPEPRIHYLRHAFTVPSDAARVHVRLTYHKQQLCQLFLSVFDPNGFRGCHMQPGAQGDVKLDLWVSPDGAGPGGVAGALPAGEWVAQIDIERTAEHAEFDLSVDVTLGDVPKPVDVPYPADHVARAEAGWYRGELHSHTVESDGKTNAAELVAAARRAGLDFLALTDHFTISGYGQLAQLQSNDLALLRGMELTGHAGHANLHGITRWHDVFVDGRADWDINQLARDVRAAGGMFCVNHAFSADLGWRYQRFDWSLADMMEIYHALEGPGNMLQIGLWDEQLRAGRRVIGVAGVDCHNPYDSRHRLGQVFTVVHAAALSEAAILAGLRTGQVYVSRGPELAFNAVSEMCPDAPVRMGGTLCAGRVNFTTKLKRLTYPSRLFVLKNGWFHAAYDCAGADCVIHFSDDASAGDYYRLELHAIPPDAEPYRKWRDWHTIQLLSNPIYVQ